jgi:hypothetical protein
MAQSSDLATEIDTLRRLEIAMSRLTDRKARRRAVQWFFDSYGDELTSQPAAGPSDQPEGDPA